MKLLLLLSLVTNVALAEVSIDGLVDEFFLRHQLENVMSENKRDCKVNPQLCAEAACKKLGTYDCNSNDEIRPILKACSRNYNSKCLDYSCMKLGTYGCNDTNEVQSVAKSCSFLPDSSCTKFVCNKLSPYDCNDMSEIVAINKNCSGRN